MLTLSKIKLWWMANCMLTGSEYKTLNDTTNSTIIHNIITLVKEHPFLNNYIATYKDQVNISFDPPYSHPLIHACRILDNTNIETIKQLILNGSNVNAKSINNSTPLIFASYLSSSNKNKIINLLIENGASLHEKNIAGQTAFDIACATNNVKVIKLFIKKGYVNINNMHTINFQIKQLVRDQINFKDNVGNIKNITCIGCNKSVRTIVALPCSHLLYCNKCYFMCKSSACKICNKKVTMYENLFF
jgi:hypothetical protein